jgi:MscS family membrane protein
MNFDELLSGFNPLGDDMAWIAQVFVVVFFVLLFNFIVRRLLGRLHQKLRQTRNPWDDALIDALRKPLAYAVWVIGIAFAVEIVHEYTQAAIFSAIDPIRDVSVIACFAWFVIRLIQGVEKNIIQYRQEKGQEVDITTVDAIAKLLRISVFITATLVTLQTLGFSISGVLAFGGIGGLAIGLAAKDLLANFFGGLMIFLDRPFDVGDWVRSPDRDIEGTVESIGWRLTRIRTFDKRPLYVPNAIFTSITVENPSRMSHRRIYETIGIRYDDIAHMDTIVNEVKQMLISHKDIDDSQTMIINFNSFGPSSVDFFVYTFTHTTNWIEFHNIKQDVLLRISNIITSHGAEIAFPTSTVHIPNAVHLTKDAQDINEIAGKA